MKIFVQTYCCRSELLVLKNDKIIIKRENDEIIACINGKRVGIALGFDYKGTEFNAEDVYPFIEKPIKVSLYKYKDEYGRDEEFLMLFAYDSVLPDLNKKVENKIKQDEKNEKKEAKKTLINNINTMIVNNDKGLSGLCEDCWNYDVMGKPYDFQKYSNHKFCPYDKEILFGCGEKSSCGCFYRCQRSFLIHGKEYREKVLKLFLDNIENNRYVHRKPVKPLLNKEEVREVEKINKAAEAKIRKEAKKRAELGKKSAISLEKNIITFHGSHKDNIPEEMYDDLAELIDGLPYNMCNMIANKEDKSFEYHDVDGYLNVYNEVATLDNSAFTLSLYRDYIEEKDVFLFSPFKKENGVAMFEATDKSREIYNKWLDFRKKNPTKNISYNKCSVQEILDDYIAQIRRIECETCLFTDHCYGLYCMKPQNKADELKKKIEELEEQFVVNLHILEACNYRCKHCFAHFDHMKMLPINTWKHVVDNIGGTIFVKRFNIAGGEPLLYPHIDELIKYIYDKGYEVSIITNGYLMTDEWLEKNAKYIHTIGFSVDSFNEETLLAMGRKTLKNEILHPNRLLELCKKIKNYGIKLKLNTVVTSLNYTEDFTQIMEDLNVDRWKVLKMKVFKNKSFDNSDIAISKKMFNDFVSKHKDINNAVFEESLVNSYIMIDASGSLVDNSGDSYVKLIDVTNEEFEEGFKKLNLDKDLYFSRYKK